MVEEKTNCSVSNAFSASSSRRVPWTVTASYFGFVLAGGVVVRRQVDDRRDPVAGHAANLLQRVGDALVGGQVDLDGLHAVERLLRLAEVDTDDAVAAEEAARDRLAEKAVAAGDEDGRTRFLEHADLPGLFPWRT
jgi:hypothetical protein